MGDLDKNKYSTARSKRIGRGSVGTILHAGTNLVQTLTGIDPIHCLDAKEALDGHDTGIFHILLYINFANSTHLVYSN